MKGLNRLPAEWEPQECIWLTYPQNRETWGPLLPNIENWYLKFSALISRYVTVYMTVSNSELLEKIKPLLTPEKHPIHLVLSPTNDCWIRDYGGICVRNSLGERSLLDFRFNSWGEKYPPWDKDNNTPKTMGQTLKLPVEELPYVLEGGSIDSNGAGLLLTSEECLLNPNRNPGISQKDWENLAKKYFGVEHILWLGKGIEGDDTDGHVDELARFADKNTVLYSLEEDKTDVNYPVLRDNRKRLQKYAEQFKLTIIPIPLPKPQVVNNLRTPGSYMNFILVNDGVIIPKFGDPADEKARKIFEGVFPHKTIECIDAKEIFFGQGGLHCISMQVPAA